ncbi:MAG: hypothetical protein ABI364_08660, partial [Caldimonas sp.]
NGPNAAICVGSSGTDAPTISIVQSAISNMAGPAITTDSAGGDGKLTADGVALTGNGRGITWYSSSAASSLDLSNVTITGNTYGGLEMDGGTLHLRSSSVSNNGAEGGVTLYSSSSGAFDLGSAASPGANIFVGNTGAGLNAVVTAGRTVSAVGNTWIANQQGADANGFYSTAPPYTPVLKAGPVNSGVNFRIYNAATLAL